MIINWRSNYRHPRLVFVFPLAMLFMGLFCLPFSILSFCELFRVQRQGVHWVVNFSLGIGLSLSCTLLILHFLSFLRRKQNELNITDQDVIFKPAHIDYSLLFERDGWQRLATQPWGFSRGLVTIRVHVVNVSCVEIGSQRILLSINGQELAIENFESDMIFNDTKERVLNLLNRKKRVKKED